MLKHIRLIDFKSFVDEQVDFAPLTLLVGANASGKSNVLDAIQFLSHLSALAIPEILDGEQKPNGQGWPGIRGGAIETARVGRSRFALESKWRASPRADGGRADDEPRCIDHRIVCEMARPASIVQESMMIPGRPRPLLRHPEPGERSSILHAFDSIGLLNRAAFEGPLAAQTQREMRAALSSVRLVDTDVRYLRGYGRRGQPLGPHGENLSGVLADLCADPAERRGFVEWLAELCAPELTDLDFITVPELGDVMAVAIERGGKRISARSLSDGTLRFLGLLLALRNAQSGACLLVEEIDAGLHPTRIRLLVEYLEAVTRERGIQVIATTHSPAVLQWLSEESLRNVVLCAVVPEREGTLLRRLGDLPHFDEVVKRKGIEELFSSGWLEMAV
jgi:predicted ATPase